MRSLTPADAATYSELQRSALQSNLDIASGAAGKRGVGNFSMVMIFNSAEWGQLQADDVLKHTASKHILAGMADAWKRLVFDIESNPRLPNLKVVAGGEYSHDHAAHVCGPFFEAAQACDKCIYPSFTMIWLCRSLDPVTRRKAHRCLQDLMTIVRFTSVV
jgi:hypothetical protein